VGTDTTHYDYDAMGNLLSVILPKGSHIDYVADGAGRRIIRKTNGQITNRWLYSDELRISGEIDSAGNVLSHFIYATKQNVPEYVVKSGIIYRVVTDQLGSVKQVINSITGEVVQSMDYDEVGNVINSTGQQIVPFGFAGGIYDSQTGLVRFGARDYDAMSGRWTMKDPLLFASQTTNHYSYAKRDPINFVDHKGLDATQNAEMALGAFTVGASFVSLLTDILDFVGWGNEPATITRGVSPTVGLFADMFGMMAGGFNYARAYWGKLSVNEMQTDQVSALLAKTGASENTLNLSGLIVSGMFFATTAWALEENPFSPLKQIVYSCAFLSTIIAGGQLWITAEINLGK